MKVYVAARFSEKARVQEIYEELIARGHSITADWTEHKDYSPFNKNPEGARGYAIKDISGVLESDVFIMLSSAQVGSGSSTELGAAIASQKLVGKPLIYIVGPHIGNNFCFFHPAVQIRESVDDVMDELEFGNIRESVG